MKYEAPYGVTDPNAPYINGNPATGQAGSIPPAAAFEYPMRELVAMITGGGETPSDADLQQLLKAARSQFANYCADVGVTNALVGVFSPAIAIYTMGMPFRVLVSHTNTGASTFDGGAGAHPIKHCDGTDVAGDDLPAGALVELVWAGSAFQMTNFFGAGGGSGGGGDSGGGGTGSNINAGFGGLRKNCVITNDGSLPNTKLNLLAECVFLEDAAHNVLRLNNLNLSVLSSTTGLGGLDTGSLRTNTPYYIWLVAKADGTSPALMLSLSSTLPNMPGTYTMAARVGCCAITDASGNFYRVQQKDRDWRFVVVPSTNTPGLPILTHGDAPWPTAVSLSPFIVPTCVSAMIAAWSIGSSGALFIWGMSNPNYMPYGSTGVSGPFRSFLMYSSGNNSSWAQTGINEIMLESSNVYYSASGTNGWAHFELYGGKDNI